jgi:hypothetical protein
VQFTVHMALVLTWEVANGRGTAIIGGDEITQEAREAGVKRHQTKLKCGGQNPDV